jgi:hypothetical protein
MSSFDILPLPLKDLGKTVAQDELTIILTPPDGSLSEDAQALKKNSAPALSRKHHYLEVHCGFFSGTDRPWIMPIFRNIGANALERRWVCHEWIKTLQSTYSLKKLIIYGSKAGEQR